MEENKDKWKEALSTMPNYQAPEQIEKQIDNHLDWATAMQGVKSYEAPELDIEILLSKPAKSRRLVKIVAIALTIVAIALLYLIYVHYSKTEAIEPAQTSSTEYAQSDTESEMINKSFDEFCEEYEIRCDRLANSELQDKWEENRMKYLNTVKKIENTGETEQLLHKITELSLTQTELISELLNEVQS